MINVFRAALTVSTGLIVARGLGPVDYGRFTFLLGTFIAIRQLLDMGSSSGFYTFISQKLHAPRFFLNYFNWLAIQFMLPLVAIGILFPSEWILTIWEGENRQIVLLAFIASFLQNQVWQTVIQIGESQRYTKRVQSFNLIMALVHVLIVGSLWLLNLLSLQNLFMLILIEYAMALLLAYLNLKTVLVFSQDEVPSRTILKKYLAYCLPLIPFTFAGFAYTFADRWLLQHYGGSVEQAFYGIGAQFATISLIGTTSILRIFWKEIAEAHAQDDRIRMSELYRRTTRTLYLIGAVISGFLLPWAGEIISVALGEAYIGGIATLMIMFLYPVHQSLGQIGGTMLLATGRVRAQAVMGIVFMSVSILVAYWVLAPSNGVFPGLNMGATGLALKMVVLQIVQVNALAGYIAWANHWKFDWLYQVVGLTVMLGIGWACYHLVHIDVLSGWSVLAALFTAGILYCAAAALSLLAMPWLIGMRRDELFRLIHFQQ